MKSWLSNLSNLGLMLVAAAVPCFIAEIGLRIAAPPADTPELFRKLPGSQAEWSGQPNARGLHAGVPVAFNRFGLRDAERSPRPAPGVTRVIALGDSVTFGMGVPQEQTYPRQLESLLGTAGAKVEVLNMGMPGYNTGHQLGQLRELGLSLEPKVVVLGFLYNDVQLSSAQRAKAAADDERSLGRKARSAFNRSMWWLKKNSLFFAWLTPRLGWVLRPLGVQGLGQVGEVKDRYVESNPQWRMVRESILEMRRLTAERGIELVVMIIPAMTKFDDDHYPIREYHEAVAAFCRESGIKHLDLLPAFWGLDGTRFWIHPTDGHPNADGQRIMAEALAEFLAPLLREKKT
ncbi:MAG TPA: GDSL-type esterase/lipase family protein [Burkholderiales bacterium]|nr:GDSL-type esterase/lipase family protein [Burkholderiales bacterium]